MKFLLKLSIVLAMIPAVILVSCALVGIVYFGCQEFSYLVMASNDIQNFLILGIILILTIIFTKEWVKYIFKDLKC